MILSFCVNAFEIFHFSCVLFVVWFLEFSQGWLHGWAEYRLDPASKDDLWNIVKNAKQGQAKQ